MRIVVLSCAEEEASGLPVLSSTRLREGGEFDMEATTTDLRRHMKDVLRALDRNEEVRVFYRGKLKGVIKPHVERKPMKITDHPYFGSWPDGEPVEALMDRLRGGSYRDL